MAVYLGNYEWMENIRYGQSTQAITTSQISALRLQSRSRMAATPSSL